MKKLHNKVVWKVIDFNVYKKHLFRETADFWVFLKTTAGITVEQRERKFGCNLFFTLGEAMAFAEKVLADKRDRALKNLTYLCEQEVKVVG